MGPPICAHEAGGGCGWLDPIAIESGLSVKKLRDIPMTQPSALEGLMATLRKLD